jgi:hypothetical protein
LSSKSSLDDPEFDGGLTASRELLVRQLSPGDDLSQSSLRSVSVMFTWLESRRRRRKPDLVPEPPEVERDSGEEEYESHEEDEREVGPSGMTRVKTDDI